MPDTAVYYEGQILVKELKADPKKKVWLNAWLGEGVSSIPKGETFQSKLHIIVKKETLNDNERIRELKSMKVDLQVGLCEKSINSQLDISRNIFFHSPIFYKQQ